MANLPDKLPIKEMITGAADHLIESDDKLNLLLVLRGSGFGAGSISLISELVDSDKVSTESMNLTLAYNSEPIFLEKKKPILNYLNKQKIGNYRDVKIGTRLFVKCFIKSNLIIITTKSDLWKWRLFADTTGVSIVHIYHGVITKSQGNLTTNKLKKQQYFQFNAIDPYPYGQQSRFDRVDVKSVASDAEAHFHAVGEGRNPTVFKKWGYPRHDRMRKVISDESVNRIVPEKTVKTIEKDNSSTKILYAPTHFDGSEVDLFRLDDFDFEKFSEFLELNNISIYMRMHPSEEETDDYQQYIEDRRIFHAGLDFSPSPIEILDVFDALITDYSSMYIDYLLLDRPILFMNGKHDLFMNNRGIAFDYEKYFPGPKIKSFEQLIDEIKKVTLGEDNYTKEREFVKNVFLPESHNSFVDNLLHYFYN